MMSLYNKILCFHFICYAIQVTKWRTNNSRVCLLTCVFLFCDHCNQHQSSSLEYAKWVREKYEHGS